MAFESDRMRKSKSKTITTLLWGEEYKFEQGILLKNKALKLLQPY